MPPMRRNDKESRDREGLLRDAPVCRLGLAGADYPYVVPLHFAWDGEVLYVHCAPEGEKLQRLIRDERVCVEIDELSGIVPAASPCGFSTRYRSLIAFGRAALVGDPAEKRRALTALTAKYAGPEFAGWELTPREIERVAVLRVHLEEVSVKQSGMEEHK